MQGGYEKNHDFQSIPRFILQMMQDRAIVTMESVTFGRLAVIDFDECYCLFIYCTVLYLDFARWSILDGVDSGILLKLLVTCILVVSFLGVLEWIFLDARGVYNGRTCG